MAINTQNVANAVVSVLTGLSGLSSAQIGAPATIGPQVTAWVAMGGIRPQRRATETTRHNGRIFVCFCYRLDGNETTAETTLMGLVDAFFAAIHADLTLGGVVEAAELASMAADEPEYQLRAGLEYREYPMVLEYTQQGTYEATP